MDDQTRDDDEDTLCPKVPEGCECPICEEARMDWLELDLDEDRVTCQTCGGSYDLTEYQR